MTPQHHPDDETLLAFAVGGMKPGSELVVRTHVQMCGRCRATLRFLDLLGGALLEDAQPDPIADRGLGRALRAIETLQQEPPGPARPCTPAAIITGLRRGSWSGFVPGVDLAEVEGGFDPDETVRMLSGKAGSPIPTHGHEQIERFIILEGWFGLDQTVYQAGDYVEADNSVIHTPFIPKDGDCLCLFVLQGGLVFDVSTGATR
jgi:putative transcriptional regulator